MSLALYRKYRPSIFADVIGQEHVTVPLSNALESGRIHHAYLFSGPRGCGKTSSARIMARSLNCEKGPTPNPCGKCQSCTDLVANGPGSIDVIELDAATHGLVDDARDLRDKAFFAPVNSRYKIYIIDEAHQLGPGAANAFQSDVDLYRRGIPLTPQRMRRQYRSYLLGPAHPNRQFLHQSLF